MRCRYCWEEKAEGQFQIAGGKTSAICEPCRVLNRNYVKGKVAKGRSIWHLYNIGPDDYDQLLEEQGGVCALCQKPMDKPHIDHCHTTGYVRGILCLSCNVGLGKFENAGLLERALEYVKKRTEFRHSKFRKARNMPS